MKRDEGGEEGEVDKEVEESLECVVVPLKNEMNSFDFRHSEFEDTVSFTIKCRCDVQKSFGNTELELGRESQG